MFDQFSSFLRLHGKQCLQHTFIGGALLTLVGCASFSARMLDAEPNIQGGLYHQFLYYGYVELARAEHAEQDYEDADLFYAKAKSAESGAMVIPDDPLNRDLTPLNRLVAVTRHTRLMNYLEQQDSMTRFPAISAKAVVAYDCWLQEVEENFQPDDIAACLDEFDKQIARLAAATAATPAKVMEANENTAVSNAQDNLDLGESMVFTVYFDLDSAALSASTLRTLDDIVAAVGGNRSVLIDVVGHADTSGTKLRNLTLSRARADAIVDALQQRGLDGYTVLVTGRGELEPAVPTADGVEERLNRRVVVTLTP